MLLNVQKTRNNPCFVTIVYNSHKDSSTHGNTPVLFNELIFAVNKGVYIFFIESINYGHDVRNLQISRWKIPVRQVPWKGPHCYAFIRDLLFLLITTDTGISIRHATAPKISEAALL